MSFARRVARSQSRKNGDYPRMREQNLAHLKRGLALEDVRGRIGGPKGEIQCPQCHSSRHLTRMACDEFDVAPQLKEAHDKLGGPGHEHVKCTACNQLIIYTLSEGGDGDA